MAKRRCCWPLLIVVVILAAVGGILLWQFLPENTKSELSQGFPGDTESNKEDPDGESGGDPEPVETLAPTPSPYEFNQCTGTDPDDCCNGVDGICDLGVDAIMYAQAHNAMATEEDGFLVGPNHEFPLEDALEAGYRGLNLDVCNCTGILTLCHGQCILGSRDPSTVLSNILSFLADNPRDVVIVTLQIDSLAGLPVDRTELVTIFQSVDGFSAQAYVHEDSTAEWPTLRSLIASGQRLILFHYGAWRYRQNGFHNWFDYGVNTEYSFQDVDAVLDTANSCQLTSAGDSSLRQFFKVNNFVTNPLPSKTAAQTLNKYDFIKDRVNSCSVANGGLKVNMLSVDFWSTGELPRFVQEYNKGLATRRQLRH